MADRGFNDGKLIAVEISRLVDQLTESDVTGPVQLVILIRRIIQRTLQNLDEIFRWNFQHATNTPSATFPLNQHHAHAFSRAHSHRHFANVYFA